MKAATPPLGEIVLNLGRADRIPPGEGRTVAVGGLEIAIFRTRQGRVFVTDAGCPHKGGPLADGIVGNRTIICPLHACTYDLETGAPAGRGCGRVKIFPTAVNLDGEILVGVY